MRGIEKVEPEPMANANNALTQEEAGRASETVARWRADPDQPLSCPRCGHEGLCVIDRSARPYAEWYVISCAGCSLEATLQIPLGPPAP